jgi:hypothetical protein
MGAMKGLAGSLFGINVVVSNTLPFTDSDGLVHHWILTQDAGYKNNEKVLVCSQHYFDTEISKLKKVGD